MLAAAAAPIESANPRVDTTSEDSPRRSLAAPPPNSLGATFLIERPLKCVGAILGRESRGRPLLSPETPDWPSLACLFLAFFRPLCVNFRHSQQPAGREPKDTGQANERPFCGPFWPAKRFARPRTQYYLSAARPRADIKLLASRFRTPAESAR